jgi:hypothetical protein
MSKYSQKAFSNRNMSDKRSNESVKSYMKRKTMELVLPELMVLYGAKTREEFNAAVQQTKLSQIILKHKNTCGFKYAARLISEGIRAGASVEKKKQAYENALREEEFTEKAIETTLARVAAAGEDLTKTPEECALEDAAEIDADDDDPDEIEA